MNIPEFVSHWVHFKIVDTDIIAGLPAFWWERIAKIVQLVSGFTILMEIFGVERIQKLGTAMDDLISWKTVFSAPEILQRALARLAVEWQSLNRKSRPSEYQYEFLGESHLGKQLGSVKVPNPNYFSELAAWEASEAALKVATIPQPPVDPITKVVLYLGRFFGVLTCVVSGFLFQKLIYQPAGGPWVLWLAWAGACVPIFFLSTYLFLGSVVILLRIPLAIFVFLVLDPVGKLLSNERFEKYALTVSFMLLILSFLIDIVLS